MRSLISLLLLTIPAGAIAKPEDPIVWKCYQCTPQEREAVAISKGVGEHLVYDAVGSSLIFGYQVAEQGGRLVAEEVTPEAWIRAQHREFMLFYDYRRGEFVKKYEVIGMIPPESAESALPEGDARLWGHHVSALNPVSAEAREIVRRSVTGAMAGIINRDREHGRLLRYEFQLDGSAPVIVRYDVGKLDMGYIEFYLDHDTRTWHYLESGDYHYPMQEKAEDFLGADGSPRSFTYHYWRMGKYYFAQRAQWAGVEVIGEVPTGTVTFDCSRRAAKTECRVR